MGKRVASNPVVVLGFGAAAMSAVLALRDSGYTGSIAIVTDAGPEPYSPVLTSYYAGGRISRRRCSAWADLDVSAAIDELHAHVRVRAIDAAAHEVETDDGQRFGYAKLLIATGAHPVAPGFPTMSGRDSLFLRTMEDADRLKQAIEREDCREVLVSGTSMVGLKVLEACLDQGVRATMLGRSPHILRAAAHASVAGRFECLLEQRGVTLRLEQTVEQADYDEARGAFEVAFSSGERSRFSEIVLAQGVEPNLGFLPEAAERREGVAVDPFMRTSMPDVFAAGDCVRTVDLSTGERRIAGLWQCAVQQGRCAGRAMAAELAGRAPALAYPGFVPCNVIHVRDLLFASAGSVVEGVGRRVELRDEGACSYAFAWAEHAGEERLVGFNVLAAGAQACASEELNGRIGRYRAEIKRTYLDREVDVEKPAC